MVTFGFYKAVSVALVIALVAVSGVAGYYYRLQSTQQAKPLPPTLKSQLFSQPVQFTLWNRTIFFTSSPMYACSNGRTIPGNVTIVALNFTENLSGRDPGSTWVTFRPTSYPFTVFNKTDLTTQLFTDVLCGQSTSRFQALAIVAPLSNWRVLASGGYSLFSDYLVYQSTNKPSTSSPEGLVASETWTVTTIS